jgi:chromosome segregation ATPase
MIADLSSLEEQLILAQADSRDMKRTVIALRSELEAAHAEIHAAALRVTQANAAEIAQLKTTVGVLREELESARTERETAVQQERVAASQEIQMLRATAAACARNWNSRAPSATTPCSRSGSPGTTRCSN